VTDLHIRLAQPDDYDAIVRLSVAAYRGDGQLTDTNTEYAATLADIATRAADAEVLVAVDGATDAVLGAVTLTPYGNRYADVTEPGEGGFRMLAVDPAAQGRGVGEALVRACVAKATADGCHAVAIFSRDFATDAFRLYSRLGFVRIPERDRQINDRVSLIAWRLPLPASF